MGELKKLHNEYYEKYENTQQGDREAVLREFAEIVKELENIVTFYLNGKKHGFNKIPSP